MKRIIEQLEEAITPSMKGRSTDVRQAVNHNGAFPDMGDRPDPHGWTLMLVSGEDQPTEGMGGPVPLALTGHRDIDSPDFVDTLQAVHRAVYRRQEGPPPPNAVQLTLPLDVRKVVGRGVYAMEFQSRYPMGFHAIQNFVRVVDDLVNFPEMQMAVHKFLETRSPISLEDGIAYLDRMVKQMGAQAQKSDWERTTGDIMHDLSYPFGPTMGTF